MLHAIGTLDVDVLVQTEFVDGEHPANFKDGLTDIGFESVTASLKAPRQSQILIASRSPMADDNLLPLPGYIEAATTNWLHRPRPALLVYLRAPRLARTRHSSHLLPSRQCCDDIELLH